MSGTVAPMTEGRPVFVWPSVSNGESTDMPLLLRLCAFISLAYTWGRAQHLMLKCPPYLGELFTGLVLGPTLLDIVPFAEALRLLGIVGILFVAFETGLKAQSLSGSSRLTMISFITGATSAAAMIFLGYVALKLSPRHHSFQEGSAGGTAMCTSSSTFSVLMTSPLGKQHVVPNMISSVAAIEGAFCLTAFTVTRSLTTGWGEQDVAQPAIAGAVLLIFCVILRAAMPTFISSQFPGGVGRGVGGILSTGVWEFDRWLLFAMFAVLVAGVAIAEVIRSSMVLGALLAGACFGRVPGALDIWDEATQGFPRPLVLLFMASSIGFTIPPTVWYTSDAVVGGFILLGFSILAKPGISFFITYLLWPERNSASQVLQVACATALPSEMGFYIAATLLHAKALGPHAASSCLWCLVMLSIIAPLGLLVSLPTDQVDETCQGYPSKGNEDSSHPPHVPSDAHLESHNLSTNNGSDRILWSPQTPQDRTSPPISRVPYQVLAQSPSPYPAEPSTPLTVPLAPVTRPGMAVQRPQPPLPSGATA